MAVYQSIVVLTGAGISAESGLKTFRDANGLWENHSIEEVCTPQAFQNNPALVYEFYNQRRNQLLKDARPNPAHIALADFQRRSTGQFTLITQNVDNLHEQAGSQNVIHMHGELLSARCIHCGLNQSWAQDLDGSSRCRSCHSKGNLRPDIVWFGEIPMHMNKIESALEQCDLFVSIGTSGHVYPAAGFVQMAHSGSAHCVELNLEPSAANHYFHECHYGKASHLVGDFFSQIP